MFHHLQFSLGDIEQIIVGLIVIATTSIAGYKLIRHELREIKRKRRHKPPKKQLAPPG